MRLALRALATFVSLSCLGCAPPSSIEMAPLAGTRMARARTVAVDGAVLSIEGEAVPEKADLESMLARQLGRKRKPFELVEDPGRADLRLYFEQADHLACVMCVQSHQRWYWWGLILDSDGRELATIHGEMRKGSGEPHRRFVKDVRSLVRKSRRSGASALED